MTCTKCGEKPEKNCGAFPKAVVEINNPEKIVLFRKVVIPASMGGRDALPPAIGKYHNVLLEYEADGSLFLYSSDGIPTQLSTDVTDLQRQLDALGIEIDEEITNRQDADTALSNQITNLDDSLATVAKTGSYNDLSNKPTIGNATLTIKKNGSNVGTFTANATADKNIDISVPTKTSNLVNDGSDGSSQYVESDDLATVATSGSYNDLTNKPTIGNATLTIKRNNTNAGTFTANATTNKSINIAVPTKTSDLTNDGSDGTSTYVETRNLPTVGNATLTITENNTSVGTFTANATSNKTINITSPTKTSDLTNDGADGTSTYVEANDLPTVDTTYNSSSNNAIANSTVTNSLDRNVMTNLAVDSTPSTTTVNLSNTKTNLAYPSSSTTSSISLPVASSTQAGVMNSATFDAVTSNTNNINAILNGAVAISNLPASPTQAQLTTAWENETGLTSLINRASVYDVTNNKVWTYYTNDQTWHAASNTSQVTVNTFTNSSEGTIKGSTNDGQVFAENDGTGSVNGWNTLTSAVSSNTSKLATIAQGAEVNVQANWTQTNTSADDYIKNKPANLVQDANYVHTDNNFTTTLKDKLNGISAGAEVNVQSDWSQTNTSADDYIKNKPANLVQDVNYVHTDNNFTTTLKNKLDGIESGAEVNVQADWIQNDTSADDYIKNKPTIPTVNNATLTIQKNGTNVQTFTANSSTNKTANITVPTAVSELTNDAGYATTTQLNNGLATKQDTLTAGDNIQINGNTISATDTTYTAGNAIDITNGEISADIHPADFFTAEDTVSDCGSDLSLDDTMASTLKSVELKGDTYQQSYSGKNLLDCNTYSGKALAADALTGEGYIKVTQNTTGSGGGNSFAYYDIDRADLASQQVTLFAKAVSGGGSTGSRIRVTKISGSPEIASIFPTTSGTSDTFNMPADGKIRIYFYINAANVTGAVGAYTEYSEVQLELGAQATSFEPYVGGTASPNPDYPQDVQVVTGEQTVTVTGKNLLNLDSAMPTINPSLNIIEQNSNNLLLEAVADSGNYNNANYRLNLRDIGVNVGETYTISADVSGTYTGSNGASIRISKNNSASGTDILARTSGEPATFVIPEGTTSIGIFFYVRQGSAPAIGATAAFANIQLEQKDSATVYEPYKGIQSYAVDLRGKNLLDISKFEMGGLSSSGVVSASTYRIQNRNSMIKVQPNTTYTISAQLSEEVKGFRVGAQQFNGAQGFLYDPGWQQLATQGYTFTTRADTEYIAIVGSLSTTSANVSTGSSENTTPYTSVSQFMRGCTLMLEKGSTATDYEPYNAIELCKIGDYQDYIYEGTDGWYLHKETARIDVSSLGGWFASGSYAYKTRNGMSDILPASSDSATAVGLCNALSASTTNLVYAGSVDYGFALPGAGGVGILIRNKNVASLADFTTYLSNNPVYGYFALATPTDTKITDATLVGQLNALGAMRSYDDQTNIIVAATGDNLPATLCVTTYRKSLDGVLDLINDTACTCKNRQGNLVITLPNGMTTYTNNDAPLPLDEALEAFEQGRSIFFVDYNDAETGVYAVSAVNANDGIWTMKVERTGTNYLEKAGSWVVSSSSTGNWVTVEFYSNINKEPTRLNMIVDASTWNMTSSTGTFTISSSLASQVRMSMTAEITVASTDVCFTDALSPGTQITLASLWSRIANGEQFDISVPYGSISSRADISPILDNRGKYGMSICNYARLDNSEMSTYSYTDSSTDTQKTISSYNSNATVDVLPSAAYEHELMKMNAPFGISKISTDGSESDTYVFFTTIFGSGQTSEDA